MASLTSAVQAAMLAVVEAGKVAADEEDLNPKPMIFRRTVPLALAPRRWQLRSPAGVRRTTFS